MGCSQDAEQMWSQSCFITRLVSSTVRISETAGSLIKRIMSEGDLKVVNKATDGMADLQTEADRSAQYCIEKSLLAKFGDKLKVIGEEDVTSVVPNLEMDVCLDVLQQDSKCSEELRSIKAEDVVVWVDPLDGTSEFAQAAKSASPLLQQVTVLIGIAYKGRSIAGVVHQPYYGNGQGRTMWAIVGVGTFGIPIIGESAKKVVVTTRSHSTPMVTEALDILAKQGLADSVERVGGAGYKVIKCLEGAAAYVFASPGCKKWDTAAPEALITASGGRLTDISGRPLYYGTDAQITNTGGVLATPHWVKHEDYVNTIPAHVKNALPEFVSKN
uniref:3'(2'),5'-bisphosphate nucleotidase 1 n=1 Tax=Steinernema glaseri TaxID=37863 RepID=A0A1I7Z4R5_9BILA